MNNQNNTYSTEVPNRKVNYFANSMNEMEVDGETLEAIIRKVGMEEQMLRQLVLKANEDEVRRLLEEKKSLEPKYTFIRKYICVKGRADKEDINVMFTKGDVVMVVEMSEGEVLVEGLTGWCEGYELSLRPSIFAECFEYDETIRVED